jgi:nicotinate-nucleotide adenylyltransferase
MRVGIFGGGFNPPHNGHVNSLQTVHRKLGIDKIYVVPNMQNPLKVPVEGPTPKQRLEMVNLALQSYGSAFEVDDQEIRRGGLSYTIDTVMAYRKKVDAENLYLIIGADNLEGFSQWKDYKKILTESNLIVTTRPGFQIPTSQDDLPEFLKELVEDYDFNFLTLKTGRNIQFITLDDVEVASSELRKWLRGGKTVNKYLSLSVENYIKEKGLYKPIGDRIGDFEKFTAFCSTILFSRKAINVKGYDVREISAPAEFTLVASGTSTRHASSLAEQVVQGVKEEYAVLPQGIEGLDEGRWVVLDYGALMIHLFYDFVRNEYSLEKIWKDARDLNLKDPFITKQ